MNCSRCGHENPGQAKFCLECGAAFATCCARCQTELPAGAKFCLECGTPVASAAKEAAPQRAPRDYTPRHLADRILQSKSALEGERKQVTVLFADVKGSMELAESIEPEQWHRLLDRFFSVLAEHVHRFEGTINQFTGDGIMALFGAPLAHEDHAQRACYAALSMRDALRVYADELRVDPGVNLSFRIGLNSGDVIVGKIGDDLRMDYTAQGYAVGLAQRMEQLAPADGIAICEPTERQVRGFFELRSLGPTRVKGVREPVGVYVLEGVGRYRTRLDSARARGLTRFVGRSDELEILEGALQRSLTGTGRVAAVVGEAGVGKSRLCMEFVERCRARELAVYEAHCPAHGRAIPFLPLLELLRDLFGIGERDGPRESRQKIAGELALLDDAFSDDRALVLDFLGVADPNAPPIELEPAARQRALFSFLRRLIQLRTEAEPIVLLIDDVHWIDPGSDLFLAQIVEAVSATRTLLLLNFRPEYTAEWTRKSWVLQLPMAPLGPEALGELVADWVGRGPSVAALPELIGARSAGNPFFAEEIVLSLIDTGALVGSRGAYELVTPIDSVEVPGTVRSLLAARIDRLTDREKQLLYTAAVIGKELPRPLLESVAELDGGEFEAALGALLAAELVYERAIFPVAEYAFKHPLTHEVALGAQLSEPRQARHAAVARAIETAEPDRLDERAGLLAHHWAEAAEDQTAAEWHARAARWVRASDLSASARHWSQARELLVELPDAPARTRLLLDASPELLDTLDRLGAEPAESAAVYSEARDLARRAGDRRAEARIEAVYGWLKSGHNDWRAVTEHATSAVALADAEGDLPVQLYGRFSLGRAMAWRRPTSESVAVFDEVEAIGGGDAAADIVIFGTRPYVEALSIRAAVQSLTGRPTTSLEFIERLPALLGRPGPLTDITSILADRIWTCWALGDAERARHFAAESLEAADRFGAERNRVYALYASGVASILGKRWDDGLRDFDRAREIVRKTGAGQEWIMLTIGAESLCWAGVGDLDRSLALSQQGIEEARAGGLLMVETLTGCLRARALRMDGSPEFADELEDQIVATTALIDLGGYELYRAQLLLERAGLGQMRGDAAGSTRDLAEARRRFRVMGVNGWDEYARSIEGR